MRKITDISEVAIDESVGILTGKFYVASVDGWDRYLFSRVAKIDKDELILGYKYFWMGVPYDTWSRPRKLAEKAFQGMLETEGVEVYEFDSMKEVYSYLAEAEDD